MLDFFMFPEEGKRRKTGHIKQKYVPGIVKKRENRAHKREICSRNREEKENRAHKREICSRNREEKENRAHKREICSRNREREGKPAT
ncbi:hypothetical protein [Mesobacillus subterraneus]|uniref:hypothetical protein n=1 Tax=Mesobacillus subterraneus TaxID=285983 RepID=UPI00203D75EB|nr:hypothetical protein [Mesobacillus subterraneus]